MTIALKNPRMLKWPFSWEDRKPMLHNRVLFVPRRYSEHDKWPFPGWEDTSLFGNTNKVCVEYCSGNGAWIVDKAKQNPSINWVAVERKFDRVRKIWSKTNNMQLFQSFGCVRRCRTFFPVLFA